LPRERLHDLGRRSELQEGAEEHQQNGQRGEDAAHPKPATAHLHTSQCCFGHGLPLLRGRGCSALRGGMGGGGSSAFSGLPMTNTRTSPREVSYRLAPSHSAGDALGMCMARTPAWLRKVRRGNFTGGYVAR